MRAMVLSLFFLTAGCAPAVPDGENAGEPAARPAEGTAELGQDEFAALMHRLADAWNEGDAAQGAACFTEDALYSEPPDKQLYRGRAELFEFFGGAAGREGDMQMRWHHLAFDPSAGIGFGEFTFTYGSSAHGVVVVRIRDGKIANWREYWYASDLPWSEFVASNPF